MDLRSDMINMIADYFGLSESGWLYHVEHNTSSRKMYCKYLRMLSNIDFVIEFEYMRDRISKHEEFLDS